MSSNRSSWQTKLTPYPRTSNESSAAYPSNNKLDSMSFRPDAPSFAPRSSFASMSALNLDTAQDERQCEHLSVSHYHLIGSTFMPPPTPPIPSAPTQCTGESKPVGKPAMTRGPLRLNITFTDQPAEDLVSTSHTPWHESVHVRGASDNYPVSTWRTHLVLLLTIS